jgi:DNA-binding NtrC family response regulator
VDVKTILLVVADAARRAALGDALRLESHSVVFAETPDEALTAAAVIPRPADLIVTDQRLDAGAGQSLANAVGRRRPGARVLYLRGFAAFSAPLPMYYLDRDASPSAVARVATRLLSPL